MEHDALQRARPTFAIPALTAARLRAVLIARARLPDDLARGFCLEETFRREVEAGGWIAALAFLGRFFHSSNGYTNF